MIKEVALVALGGGVGSVFRFLTSYCVAKIFSGYYPLATFIVNLSGCLLIGFLIELASYASWFDNSLRLLLITGLCGGFTTFSTFSAENMSLLQSGHYLTLTLYIAGSVVFGMLALYLGMLLGRLVIR